jgi:ribonuclease BN (tRNA processing enzyme)
VHDAQYLDDEMAEKRGWGHSTIPQVLDLGRQAEARRVALYHHDPDRHDDALDEIGSAARRWWATHARAGEVFVASEQRTLEITAD